ncbi:hypothetical protein MAP00_007964 [Monascus purpureus]|nr:hypothetical protein MAP00_007964 [Monascus purpureus]
MRVSAWSLALATVPAIATALRSSFVNEQRSNASSSLTAAAVSAELAPKLSANSSIFAQNDPRWFIDLVNPTQVKYANSHGVPFHAVNRGHGSTETLGRLKNGIEISMAQLTDIKIADDEASAFFGGGVWDGQVIDALWEKGFVTGIC